MSNDVIFRNVLESLSNGVMTIGFDGRILTFNAAAEAILGMKADEVLQKSFAEVFLPREGNDPFNQTILNAIYEADTIQNKIVPWQRSGDTVLTLEVTTSFLATDENGAKKNAAVIAVFSDISEIDRLRESEKRLSEELKENHRALQKSYLEMEETNGSLQAALRKVQMIRVVATVFVILLFVGIGLFTWKQTGHFSRTTATAAAPGGAAERVYTVTPQPLTDSISMKGTLKPIQVVNVTSPFGGMVKEKYFEYGQAVTKGQLLLKLDRAETEMKYREARTAFIEAQEKLREVEHWSDSNEMAKAQQSVTRSKLTLDGHNKTFEETERLFKKEIVPATEYNNAKQQFTTAKMDYDSALRELQIVKEKGEGQNRDIAKLKLENARQKMQDLESQLRLSDIYAPVSGTILLPDLAGGDKDKKAKNAERGVSFSQGDILLAIGNTEGLAMSAEVDEMEVLKIKKDQEVRITVDAFGETVKGKVAYISSQAVKSDGGKKTASFEVTVTMENLPASLSDKLRLGMSANMEIMILNKPNVILLPLQAVAVSGNDRFVNLRDKGAATAKKVKVETGITTLDSVEITSGLKAGDEVTY
ncbi:MAG: HlyD family efflux transporter periplasmic adaptor subunit [Deltaproteobacteria bacterium]|nr:HlyD family efflux transporter periplasmic adaptor subunit [Deltaproteobacteria bacterium]